MRALLTAIGATARTQYNTSTAVLLYNTIYQFRKYPGGVTLLLASFFSGVPFNAGRTRSSIVPSCKVTWLMLLMLPHCCCCSVVAAAAVVDAAVAVHVHVNAVKAAVRHYRRLISETPSHFLLRFVSMEENRPTSQFVCLVRTTHRGDN